MIPSAVYRIPSGIVSGASPYRWHLLRVSSVKRAGRVTRHPAGGFGIPGAVRGWDGWFWPRPGHHGDEKTDKMTHLGAEPRQCMLMPSCRQKKNKIIEILHAKSAQPQIILLFYPSSQKPNNLLRSKVSENHMNEVVY